jgi:hypothetical protein
VLDGDTWAGVDAGASWAGVDAGAFVGDGEGGTAAGDSNEDEAAGTGESTVAGGAASPESSSEDSSMSSRTRPVVSRSVAVAVAAPSCVEISTCDGEVGSTFGAAG